MEMETKIYNLHIIVYLSIYILGHNEIEKSILHRRMMVKLKKKLYIDIYENLKSPYISNLTC